MGLKDLESVNKRIDEVQLWLREALRRITIQEEGMIIEKTAIVGDKGNAED